MDVSMDEENTANIDRANQEAAPVREAGQVNFDSNQENDPQTQDPASSMALPVSQKTNDIDLLKEKVSVMEQESARLHEMQQQILGDDSVMSVDNEEGKKHLSIQERQEIDNRSVYVGNIDYSATPEEVGEVFKDCGTINRITILTNKITGTPLGYGYVEFEKQESTTQAVTLDQSLFKGRPLKVSNKRTNVPGFGRGRGRGGFRGRGDRGGARGGFRGRGGRGSRGSFRGALRGGRGGFQPY